MNEFSDLAKPIIEHSAKMAGAMPLSIEKGVIELVKNVSKRQSIGLPAFAVVSGSA